MLVQGALNRLIPFLSVMRYLHNIAHVSVGISVAKSGRTKKPATSDVGSY